MLNRSALHFRQTLLKAAAVMIAISGATAIALVYPPCSHAQSQPLPAFEVATVKRSDASRGFMSVTGGPGTRSPGQFTATKAPLAMLIMHAYEVRSWQFIAPDWLRDEKFDIVAKIPDGATKAQVNLMLQTLLMERLGLVAHKEMKTLPVYEVVLGKNSPKFRKSKLPPGTEPGQSVSTRGLPADKDGWPMLPSDANGITTANSGGKIRWMFRNQPLAGLVNILQNHVGQTVIDKTELSGTYDFDLTIIPPANSQAPIGEPASLARSNPGLAIIDAVADIGLKLVSTKGPVEVLVVDRVNKEPTEN